MNFIYSSFKKYLQNKSEKQVRFYFLQNKRILFVILQNNEE